MNSEMTRQRVHASFYDPATGQFLSRDPAVAATRSAYGYVYGNPLNGSDPSGMFGLGFKIPDWVPVVGGSDCVDIGDSNCNSVKEQNPAASQAAADVAGGVINGMALGHGQGALDAIGLGHNVDLKSDEARLGRYVGTTVVAVASLQYPVALGYLSSVTGLLGIYQGCAIGGGAHPGCGSAIATNAPSFVLGGFAGFVGNGAGAFASTLLTLLQGRVGNDGVSYESACR